MKGTAGRLDSCVVWSGQLSGSQGESLKSRLPQQILSWPDCGWLFTEMWPYLNLET